MRIKRFSVQNYKIHKRSSIDLFPITVLVGPNGGGKSSFFDALTNFSMVARGPISEAFSGWPYSFEACRHHGSMPTSPIGYKVLFETSTGSEVDYSISFCQQEHGFIIRDERVLSGGNVVFDRGEDVCKLDGVSQLIAHDTGILAALRRAHRAPNFVSNFPDVSECARGVSRIARYRLESENMRRPSSTVDPPEAGESSRMPRVGYHGEDLATVLYYLHETNIQDLETIAQEASKALRGFEGFDFNYVPNDRIGFSGKFSDSRGTVAAANLSDGSLSVLGLLTVALSPDHPDVLCIEEPENGMTPRALKVIYESLCKLTKGPSALSQVLLSSHSPYVIVDAWNGDDREFIYQCYPKDGACEVRKFSEAVAEAGHLKAGGEISIRLAESVMDGFRSPT